jgi:hypothetical protein
MPVAPKFGLWEWQAQFPEELERFAETAALTPCGARTWHRRDTASDRTRDPSRQPRPSRESLPVNSPCRRFAGVLDVCAHGSAPGSAGQLEQQAENGRAIYLKAIASWMMSFRLDTLSNRSISFG